MKPIRNYELRKSTIYVNHHGLDLKIHAELNVSKIDDKGIYDYAYNINNCLVINCLVINCENDNGIEIDIPDNEIFNLYYDDFILDLYNQDNI